MSSIFMVLIGGIGSITVLQYFLINIYRKKHGKEKKIISEELIELLKE